MQVLNGLDTVMPAVASATSPLIHGVIGTLFGGLGGVIYAGFLVAAASAWKDHGANRAPAFGFILALALIPLAGYYTPLGRGSAGWWPRQWPA